MICTGSSGGAIRDRPVRCTLGKIGIPKNDIAGTPAQVAEQIIAQCRACNAGHVLAILGRTVGEHRIREVEFFGGEVIPILRQAETA